MSARKKNTEGGGGDGSHGEQEVWVTFSEMNHFRLFAMTARWSREEQQNGRKFRPGAEGEHWAHFLEHQSSSG